MFKFFQESKELIISESIETAGKAFMQALGLIGKVRDTSRLNNGSLMIRGKLSHGFQKVPVSVQLVKRNDGQIKVTLFAECDDRWREAATQAIERWLQVYHTVLNGDADALSRMMSADEFKNASGVSKKRIAFLLVVMIVIVVGGAWVAKLLTK